MFFVSLRVESTIAQYEQPNILEEPAEIVSSQNTTRKLYFNGNTGAKESGDKIKTKINVTE